MGSMIVFAPTLPSDLDIFACKESLKIIVSIYLCIKLICIPALRTHILYFIVFTARFSNIFFCRDLGELFKGGCKVRPAPLAYRAELVCAFVCEHAFSYLVDDRWCVNMCICHVDVFVCKPVRACACATLRVSVHVLTCMCACVCTRACECVRI